ncbi:MAG: phosphoribosylformylglycinamidine synthase subunit PurQ [Spirochaetes bacterium]|nr:MAG: phosphoribosylformylglycinamidine synthase subunit PurQ [Spirochaetota bacterium]
MAKPTILVLTGYGINCDEEVRYSFACAGANARIVHINDIIETPAMLAGFQVIVFPGGFAYGDDTGSGKALANRIRSNLREEVAAFAARDTLMLGICNGFQVMVALGLVPAFSGTMELAEVALEHNASARYECRWVDLAIEAASPCVFTKGMGALHVPVAHGEGNFYAPPAVYERLEREKLVAMRYSRSNGAPAAGEFPFNPNGSMGDVAAICDSTGRRMGMMPHPERHILFYHREDWTLLREKARREGREIPEEGEGLAIFRNAVRYFE